MYLSFGPRMQTPVDGIGTSTDCDSVTIVDYFDGDDNTPAVLTSRTPRGFADLVKNSQLNFIDLSHIRYVERNWARRKQ